MRIIVKFAFATREGKFMIFVGVLVSCFSLTTENLNFYLTAHQIVQCLFR